MTCGFAAVDHRRRIFSTPSLNNAAALLLPGCLLFTSLCVLRPPPFMQQLLVSDSGSIDRLVRSRGTTGGLWWWNTEDGRCSSRDPSCLEFATEGDLLRMKQCENKLQQYGVEPWRRGSCKLRNGTGKLAVALASFPGSGNTWVRSLLERVSGVCTGSVTCDISLRAGGFVGEFIRSSSVVLVKTHELKPSWAADMRHYQPERFNKAVVLVRNPFKAAVADWHRMVANGLKASTVNVHSHIQEAGPQWFGEAVYFHFAFNFGTVGKQRGHVYTTTHIVTLSRC